VTDGLIQFDWAWLAGFGFAQTGKICRPGPRPSLKRWQLHFLGWVCLHLARLGPRSREPDFLDRRDARNAKGYAGWRYPACNRNEWPQKAGKVRDKGRTKAPRRPPVPALCLYQPWLT